MSERALPSKVKLFFSVLANNIENLNVVVEKLANLYGKIDFESEIMPFDFTDYYEKEFGKGLIRKLFSFKKLIFPDELVDVKLKAYEIEQKMTIENKRLVNIDPGYLSLARVVLSTGKDFTHRIYLNQGVYADLTLIYKKGKGYISLPWTYPDYASEKFLTIFNSLRRELKTALKGETK